MMISRFRRQLVKAGVICSVALASMFGMASSASAVTTLTKSPDQGNYWSPLQVSGTFVYANSFIMPNQADVQLTSIGIWLRGGSSQVKFELLADTGFNSPDGAVILTSSAISSFSLSSLTLETLNVTPINLTPGTRYWVAGSTVGLSGSGAYNVGGHTQNSQSIIDNGTFWYSNDSAGLSFDGQNNTPEMAFQLTFDGGQAIPAPAASFLGLAGFGLLALRRVRKA